MQRIERGLLTQLDDERALLVGLSGDAEVYRLRYRPTFQPSRSAAIFASRATAPTSSWKWIFLNAGA
jgi:hypothetical protein